jgi:hypothetical protein
VRPGFEPYEARKEPPSGPPDAADLALRRFPSSCRLCWYRNVQPRRGCLTGGNGSA